MGKILFIVLTALAFTASADQHEGGEMDGDMAKKVPPFAIYGDFSTSMFFFGNGNAGGTPENNSRHGDFMIDLVEINLQKTWSDSKLHLGIGYGPSAAAVNNFGLPGSPTTGTLNVTSAFYEMESNYGLTFKAGKFKSFMGYEDYVHMNNMQFTRSHAYYSLTPNIHTGLGVSYDFEKMLNVGAYILNNTTNSQPNNYNDFNTYALAVNINPTEMISVDVNYMAGVDGGSFYTTILPSSGARGTTIGALSAGNLEFNIIDAAAAIKVNEMFDAALTYTSKTAKATAAGATFIPGAGGTSTTATEASASSIGVYANASFGAYSAGLRYEILADDDGLVTGVADNSVNALTLGLHANIDQNARVSFEYRSDAADKKMFVDSEGTSAEDTQDLYGVALQYRF